MSKPSIIVYSADWCPYCKQAMAYFKSKDLEYTEKNVEKEPDAAQEMIDKSHQQAIPVIDIDGTIIVGYDLSKINAALASAK